MAFYSTFTNIEHYLKETIHLFGCNDPSFTESAIVAKKRDELVSEFPFSCQLSSQLPSSFEGKFGYIRYRTTAVVDILSDDDVSIALEKPFTVVNANNDDQPSTHDAREHPLMAEITTTFGHCCSIWNSKPLCLIASTPRTSYRTNEKIVSTVKFC